MKGYDFSEYDIGENFGKRIGAKILHLSDLHNHFSSRFIDEIQRIAPDVVVITGDLINHKNHLACMQNYLRRMTDLTQVFFVAGNHECASKDRDIVFDEISESRVQILNDGSRIVTVNGEKINLIGLTDILYYAKNKKKRLSPITKFSSAEWRQFGQYQRELISKLKVEDAINIILTHRPDLFESFYATTGVHLVLAGHVHGGEIRLPHFGAVYATGQGFFPKYAEGLSSKNGVTIIVSRGLGKSIFPFRINNPYEMLEILL